jgi:hypothetical protein
VLAIARLEATRTPATRTRRQGTVLALLALLVAALVALLVHLARLG